MNNNLSNDTSTDYKRNTNDFKINSETVALNELFCVYRTRNIVKVLVFFSLYVNNKPTKYSEILLNSFNYSRFDFNDRL